MKDVLEEKCQEWKWTPSAARTREMILEDTGRAGVVQPHSCLALAQGAQN